MKPHTDRVAERWKRYEVVLNLAVLRGLDSWAPAYEDIRDNALRSWENILNLPEGALHISRFADGYLKNLTVCEIVEQLQVERRTGVVSVCSVDVEYPVSPERRILVLLDKLGIEPCQRLGLTLDDTFGRKLEDLGFTVKHPSRKPSGLHLDRFKIIVLDTSHGLKHKHSLQWTMRLERFTANKPVLIPIKTASIHQMAIELYQRETMLEALWGR